MSKRTLIAKLKRIAAHDEQMSTIRAISDLMDELATPATVHPRKPDPSLEEILTADEVPST